MLYNTSIETVKRGDIFYADIGSGKGSEQTGSRPVLIIQNDVGNKHSPTVIAAMITSKLSKAKLPTHVEIKPEESGLAKDSVILLEQIRTIDKKRLERKVGHVNDRIMREINTALAISIGLGFHERGGSFENQRVLYNGTTQGYVLQAQ
jgi:mRNA interferase MazF